MNFSELKTYIDTVAPNLGNETASTFVALAHYQIEVCVSALKDPNLCELGREGASVVLKGYSVLVKCEDIFKFSIAHRMIQHTFKLLAPMLSKGYYDHLKMVRLVETFDNHTKLLNDKAGEFFASRN